MSKTAVQISDERITSRVGNLRFPMAQMKIYYQGQLCRIIGYTMATEGARLVVFKCPCENGQKTLEIMPDDDVVLVPTTSSLPI